MFFVCDAITSPYRVVVKAQPKQCWQTGSKVRRFETIRTHHPVYGSRKCGKTWLDVTAYMRCAVHIKSSWRRGSASGS